MTIAKEIAMATPVHDDKKTPVHEDKKHLYMKMANLYMKIF